MRHTRKNKPALWERKSPSLCYLLQADPAGAPAVQWLSAEAAALLVDGEAMRMRKTSAGRVSALAVACQSQPTHAACCAVRATRAACILCVIVMLLVCSLARPCCLFITVDTIAIPTPATSAPGLRSPLPHLHRDCARPCHVCTGTALAPATSAPGLGWLVTVRVTAKRRIRFFLQPATSTTHWRTIVGSRWPPPLRIWTKCKACSASAL